MIGQTEALLKLGTAIVTFVAKKWMGDKSLAANLTVTLSQIFETKLTGVLNQRRLARQFDAIAERIAETLSPLLEVEFSGIDEGSRQAVINAVTELLQATPIDGKVLLAYDLNPTRLEQHFAQHRSNYIRQFSSDETALFERLLSECCQYMIDLSARLPRFSEQSLGELLARESTLMQRLEEVIKTTEQIRSNTRHEGPEATRHFEERYRRAVIRRLDRLELVGVDVSRESSQHQLSVAYVAVSVSPRHGNWGGSSIPDEVKSALNVDGGASSSETMTSVERALISGRRLVIAGLAGAGKTTLLKWTAVQIARGNQQGALAEWKGSVPFLVQLRQFDGPRLRLPVPEEFVGLLAPEIAGLMPRGWVHNCLQSGIAVVLVDGMDEVPERERVVVRDWLDQLLESYPDNRYIITSRPHAIKDAENERIGWSRWFARQGFSEAELLPMGMAQIEALVRQWHEAVALELQDVEARDALPQLAQRLVKRLRADRALRSLAETPLLCAVICALHRDRRTHLPRDRVSLYEKCCELLLDRRDQEREISLADYPDLSLREKSALVEDLAYYLMKNRWSEVDTVQADRRLARTGGQLTSIKKKIPGKALRRLLVERCGLLLEPALGRLAFAHRTFQEYLAARAAVEEGDYGVLLEHVHEDLWKEVIVLAAGIAKRAEAEELIEKLMEIVDQSEPIRHRCYALAIACCGSARRLSPRIRDEIDQRLKQLPRPTDQDEARAFAAAGDHAIPYLNYAPNLSKRKLSSSVNTLGLIGSDAALDVLEAYANDESREVSSALLQGWEEFPDRNEYARRVLCRISRLDEELSNYTRMRPLASLDGIEHFAHLPRLSITASPQLTDLRPLGELVGLKSLTLNRIDGVIDLSPLSLLGGLIKLQLFGVRKLADLSPLSALGCLEELRLKECPQVHDLTPLSVLKSLRLLYFAGVKKLPSFEPLAQMTKLQHLEVGDCESVDELGKLRYVRRLAIRRTEVGDISPLAGLTQLKRLEITATGSVKDLNPLSGLSRLTELILFNCRGVESLAPLGQLNQLERLILPVCTASTDLAALEQLERLQDLQFAWSKGLPSLLPLSRLPNLRAVTISHDDELTNIEPLKALPQLTDLILDGCMMVSDLSPLASLSRLERLKLIRCPLIFKLDALLRLPALKQVDIHSYSVQYVEKLRIPDGLNVRVHINKLGF